MHMLRTGRHAPPVSSSLENPAITIDDPPPQTRSRRRICEVVIPRHPQARWLESSLSSHESTPTFQELMHSADPILGKYCRRFVEAGILDMNDLRAFVAFPRAEMERFILNNCGPSISPFQVAQVVVALQGAKVFDLISQ